MAELVATRSTCFRRSVGCVLVDHNNHVLATGYNGVARGRPHCNEATLVSSGPNAGRVMFHNTCQGARAPSGTALSACEAIHAEENALIQCRTVNEIRTVYCTASPCVLCMRKLLNTGVKRIVFRQEYPHAESKQLAADAGIEWCHCP